MMVGCAAESIKAGESDRDKRCQCLKIEDGPGRDIWVENGRKLRVSYADIQGNILLNTRTSTKALMKKCV